MMVRYFSFLALLAFGLSCTQKATPSKSSMGENVSYNEDIDYLLPQYAEKVSDEIEKQEEEKPVYIENTPISDDNTKVDAISEKIIENNKSYNNGQGFRIQVFSGNSRTDFENARSYLLRGFPQLEVYESYSQPTYKIKTGDFITYYDAEKFLSSLKSRFGTARIVNDKINIKKALNIK